MGEREVPTELVRHILSFLSDDPAVWVRTTSGVCQVWRAVSHDLLRHHAARTLSLLPPTLPHPSCAPPPRITNILLQSIT
jgi:hypothetical protein